MNIAIKNLLALHPFDFSPKADALLKKALALNYQHQLRSFPQYKNYVEKRKSLLEYPPIYLPLLKEMAFNLPNEIKIVETITSSGSKGLPTQIPLGADDLENRLATIHNTYTGMNILPPHCHAYFFLIPPSQTKMAGTTIIHQTLSNHPNIQKLSFAVEIKENKLIFDKKVIDEILSDAESKMPTLIVGYPALIAQTIKNLKECGLEKISLSPGSFILTGGGWKSFLSDVHVDYHQFKTTVSDFFEIPKTHIRDMFGLSESPVVFIECENGYYHIPNFCRVRTFDPIRGSTQSPHENESTEGLMLIESPFSSSYPLLSILTTDKIRLNHRCQCQCEIQGNCFLPLGRASLANYKTCAMKISSQLMEA